jgi:hypothetical protein
MSSSRVQRIQRVSDMFKEVEGPGTTSSYESCSKSGKVQLDVVPADKSSVRRSNSEFDADFASPTNVCEPSKRSMSRSHDATVAMQLLQW